MKKWLPFIIAGILALGLAQAVGAEVFGPFHQKGGLAVGSGYSYEQIGIKDMENPLKLHQTYLRVDYTFLESMTVFGTIGGATMQIKDGIETGKDFQSDMAPFAAVGFKGAIVASKDLYVGAFARYARFGEMRDKGHVNTFDVETNIQDLALFTAGAGVQYDAADMVSLYAGVLYRSISSGTAELSIASLPYTQKADLTDKSSLGGFGGVKFNLSKNFGATLEYGFVNSYSNIGVYLGYAF